MFNKLKIITISLVILFSAILLIKFVSVLAGDDCTSNWRLVFHTVHQEKCYALENPTCKNQQPQPAGYPKCLTQPNCISEAKMIQIKGQQCLDQTNLGCEATSIEENPALSLCPAPACYSVLPSGSCQQDELGQSVKFIGQDDTRCEQGQDQPADKGYCSCKAFSDEDLSLKSYLTLTGGVACDLTSSGTPLYIYPTIKTLTPFCQNHKINIQRVCRGAPKINKVYLDGSPAVNYGPPGSKIIIQGLNLGNTIRVAVGDQPAEILSAGEEQVKVKIYKDPGGKDPHWCANSVVLTTASSQTRLNDLLESVVADTPLERSAVGYFMVADKKVSAAELDKDTDSDGQRDETDNCLNTANANQIDNDHDGQGDSCDADIDGDGILNSNDNCSYVKNANQENQKDPKSVAGDACEIITSSLDTDGDTIADAADNCPQVNNPSQNASTCADLPSNIETGDTDSDSDGQRDETDNCPSAANANQIDNDHDGQGDSCDADIDGDGILNSNDNCSYVKNANQENQKDPKSVAGDACEIITSSLDADGDFIADITDNCPYVSNKDQNSSACADLPSNTPHYGRISFNPAKGVFGTIITIENDKKVLGEQASRSWVTFAGQLETPSEFYATEKTYWTPDIIRVKTPRADKEKVEGKIRVHLCSPTENRDVYLETDKDFKLIEPATASPFELEELAPKIAYFTPDFGVNRRQWQEQKDPYNSEYQEEVSVFGRNFNFIDQVSIIDQKGAEFITNFVIESPYKIIVQLPSVNLPANALDLYFGQFKVCRGIDCDLSKTRFYFQDYAPAVVRQPEIQEIKTLPEKADGFDFNPPYFYKLNQIVTIIGRNFGASRNDSQVLFWSPAGYLEAGGYNKWSNREIQAVAPNNILSSEAEYKDFSSGAAPILICAKKYGCSSSLNYYPREKFEIGVIGDPNQALAELGQPEIIPEIFHLNKSCSAPGGSIIIRGYNFWDKQVDSSEGLEYYVSFQGQNDARVKAVSYLAWSAEAIKVALPAGAETGRAAVHRRDKNSTNEKIGFSDEILTISPTCSVSSGYCFAGNQLPEIFQIDPAREYIGLNQAGVSIGAQEKVITIRGCNLGQEMGSSYVLFNDIKHNKIISWNSYEVKVLTPFDAVSGPVSLYIWDGSVGYQTNELNFQASPVIQKISPNRGAANQIITVLGSDFCQTDSCLNLPEVYLSSYQDLGLLGVKAKQLLSFNRRQIKFKLDRGVEDDYDSVEQEKKIDYKNGVYSGLLYIKRADGILSRPYQTVTRGHFGYFAGRPPNFFTKLPLLKDVAPSTVLAGQDTKILLKGEGFYGTANIPAELFGYAYGSYPKIKIWNYFLENLNLATKEDYLVKQGAAPGAGPEISFDFIVQDETGLQAKAVKFAVLKLEPSAGSAALSLAGNQDHNIKLKIAATNNQPQIIAVKKLEPTGDVAHLGDKVKFSFSVQDQDGNWGSAGGPGGWNWTIIAYIDGSRSVFQGSVTAMTAHGLFPSGSVDEQTGEAGILIDPQYVKFNQSLEMQELTATYTLSPFTQKNGIINRHSVLGINYDGSFGMFFKSNAPRLDLRPIVNYETADTDQLKQISFTSGRAYYGYFSHGRTLRPKFNLLAENVAPFAFKIKNPDFQRQDPEEKAEIEFTLNKEWLATIYKSDRISVSQGLPAINQVAIFDIKANSSGMTGETDFNFSIFNGLERYYKCNYLDAPAGEEKIIVCNSEPNFPGVIPGGQSSLASYGFFQTNQFVVDCAPPKIKSIAVVSSSQIKVAGENLNNASVTINGKGYKAGFAGGVLTVSVSKKLSPGVYTLRAQSRDRCATAARYDEKKFKI